MDLGSLRTLALAVNFSAHGVDVTVQRPDEDSFEARGIWVTQATDDAPTGLEFQRKEPRRVMAFRRSEVETIPRGTTLLVAETSGGTSRGWRVDGIERIEAEHVRVVVTRDPDLDAVLDID